MNFVEFVQMGGYAKYIWSSYGLTLAVLVFVAWSARRAYAEAIAKTRRSHRAAATSGSKL